MAHDDGTARMADIQRLLNVDASYARQYRLRLIVAELIYRTRRGYVDFTMSYLREYLRDHAAADLWRSPDEAQAGHRRVRAATSPPMRSRPTPFQRQLNLHHLAEGRALRLRWRGGHRSASGHP